MEAESREWQHLSKDNNKADGSRKIQNMYNNKRVSVYKPLWYRIHKPFKGKQSPWSKIVSSAWQIQVGQQGKLQECIYFMGMDER